MPSLYQGVLGADIPENGTNSNCHVIQLIFEFGSPHQPFQACPGGFPNSLFLHFSSETQEKTLNCPFSDQEINKNQRPFNQKDHVAISIALENITKYLSNFHVLAFLLTQAVRNLQVVVKTRERRKQKQMKGKKDQ